MAKRIFVFGSNTAGIHGSGAARTAYEKHGARWGSGYGHVGDSFAIPTKGHFFDYGQKPNVGKTLSLDMIRGFVVGFLAYAHTHPELTFQVTAIGCGLAGLQHEDIAPMFATAPMNCEFDSAWQPTFDKYFFGLPRNYWGTF